MSIEAIERPVDVGGSLAALTPTSASRQAAPTDDPFDLDITFIEHGPTANTVIAMTDDGCGSSCPSACTTSTSA
jgi:FxLD family lantipeptide